MEVTISEEAITTLLQSFSVFGGKKAPLVFRQIINTVLIPILETELLERGIPFPARIRHEDGQKRLSLLFEIVCIAELTNRIFHIEMENYCIKELRVEPVHSRKENLISAPSVSGDSTTGDVSKIQDIS
jgi:hypothetical protein